MGKGVRYSLCSNANLKSIVIDMEVWNHCPLSQFNFIRGFASSGGRNSAGRYGFPPRGGVKRLPRKIDVKRSNSALGIVERIEYDPNRSARIAFVRWVEGVKVRRKHCNVKGEFSALDKMLEPTTTNIRGLFSFCSMPGKTVQRKVACDSPATMVGYAAVGVPTTKAPLSNAQSSTARKKNSARDVFMSAFSPGAAAESASISSGKSSVVPRMVVAGAKPLSFLCKRERKLKTKAVSLLVKFKSGE